MSRHSWRCVTLLSRRLSASFELKSGYHYLRSTPCKCENYETLDCYYSRFQLTFHCDIPIFVAKFGSSLWISNVHFRICKPVCKLSIWLASLSPGANHSLCLQTGLRIRKWTLELRNEVRNITVKSVLESMMMIASSLIICFNNVSQQPSKKFCSNTIFLLRRWYKITTPS